MGTLYKLTFSNAEFYIGITTNFKLRMQHHNSTKGKGSPLLASCWKNNTLVKSEVLAEIEDEDQLREAERKAIEELKPSLNTLPGGELNAGLNHPRSKYSREQVLEVVRLFVGTNITYKDIAKATGVGYASCMDIVKGRAHAWATKDVNLALHAEKRKILEYRVFDKYNNEYRAASVKELEAKVGHSCASVLAGQKAFSSGLSLVKHPVLEITSPDKETIKLTEPLAREFLKECELSRYQIAKLLSGKSTSGWESKICI